MGSPGDSRHARIIVVDADPDNVKWLRQALGEGYAVDAVASGSDAMYSLATHGADLMIVGAQLTDMSGAELLARVGEGGVASLLVVDPDVERSDARLEQSVFYVLNRKIAPGDVRAIVDGAVRRPRADTEGEVSTKAEAERMQLLLEAAHRLAVQTEPAGAARVAVKAVVEFCDADRAHCLFYDADSGALWSEVEEDADAEQDDRSAAAGLAGFAAHTGSPLAVDVAQSDGRYRRDIDDPRGDGQEHLMVQPVADTRDTIHAVLVAVRRGSRPSFRAEDVEALASIADQWGPLLQRLAMKVEAESLLEEVRAQEDAEGVFRREAVEAYVSHLGHGDVVRVSPAWVSWTYRALVLMFLAGIAYLWLGTVDEYSVGPAIIQTSGRTEVTAPVAGTIVSTEVSPGQRVTAGQVLARYHNATQEAEFDRVERRWESLLRDYLFAPSNDATRRALISVRSERDRAVALLEELTVRAPHAGIVSEMRVRDSQHVVPGNILMSLTDEETDMFVTALLPGGDRPQLRPGMSLRLELLGYKYAYQDLIVESISDEVIGPAEARRYFGERLGDTIAVRGPIVLVRARLDTRTFIADDIEYDYHDGMQGRAEVRVRSERIITTLMPGLKGL